MKKFDSINVIPFIDILLVLLAIVLMTSTFVVQSAIKVDLPNSTSISKIEPKNYEITIDKEGKVFFQKEEVLLDSLDEKLNTLELSASFNIFCDKEAKFDYFILVLEKLKNKSFDNIAIAVEK